MTKMTTSKEISNSGKISGLVIMPNITPVNTIKIMVYTTKNPSKMSVRRSVILVSLYSRAKQQNTTDSAIVITKIPTKKTKQ